MNSTLFTELTISEEAILSGGEIKATSTKTTTTRSNSNVKGASGGVASGGSIGDSNAPSLSGSEGVYISN